MKRNPPKNTLREEGEGGERNPSRPRGQHSVGSKGEGKSVAKKKGNFVLKTHCRLSYSGRPGESLTEGEISDLRSCPETNEGKEAYLFSKAVFLKGGGDQEQEGGFWGY